MWYLLPFPAQLLPNKNAQNFPPMSRFLNNTFITIYCTKLFYFIPMTTGHLHTNFHGTDQNGIVASSHKTFSLIHRERSSISMGNMHSWGGWMCHWTPRGKNKWFLTPAPEGTKELNNFFHKNKQKIERSEWVCLFGEKNYLIPEWLREGS